MIDDDEGGPAMTPNEEQVQQPSGDVGWVRRALREVVRRDPLLVKLVGNVGWLLSERAFTLVTGFFVNIWFVKYLGPEAFGSYSYAVSLATLCGSLAALGTDAMIVRHLALAPASEGAILGTALRVRLCAAAIGWVSTVLAVRFLQTDALSRALVAIMSANALCTSIGVFDLWFQARLNARPLITSRILIALSSQATRVGMIAAGAMLTSFAWLYLATGAAMSCAAYGLYRRLGGRGVRLVFNRSRARELLRESWPIGIAGIAIMVYLKIDQVMLGQLASKQEVGLYAAAATLSELWYVVPVAIGTSVFPLILDEVPRQGLERGRRLQRFYDAMAATSLLIAVLTSLTARGLVTTLYGPAYARAADILVVHVWSLPFVSLGIARARCLVADKMTVFVMLAALLGGITNVALNLYLIPRYGGLGAAWATLISYGLADYASSAMSQRTWAQFGMQTRALAVFVRPRTLLGLGPEREG